MSQTITLYVDGACRGNPGLGGWGAYIIRESGEEKICGGEENTTNNRSWCTNKVVIARKLNICAPRLIKKRPYADGVIDIGFCPKI